MERRRFLGLAGAASLASGFAGCMGVLSSETTFDGEVLDFERGKRIAFASDGEEIADVLFERRPVPPADDLNFRVRPRHKRSDIEWSQFEFMMKFDDHHQPVPHFYIQGRTSTSPVSMYQNVREETFVEVNLEETTYPPNLDFIAVRPVGADEFDTTELAVDLQLSLAEEGNFPTEYVGEHSFSVDLQPDESEDGQE